ncbi:hypothetical protein GQ53DRAFT_800779 [Thozetella sp. PMI_491]|nr:hypothetical protein GQ53DRAFT_800779 [Thozetella sp. PMI_491]
MSIQDLAPELLRQCLSYLGFDDFSRTSLVCRDWLAPSREILWSRISLNLDGEIPGSLATLLNEKTSIPRRIQGIAIDESESIHDRSEEETTTWYDGLSTVLRHFESIANLTIQYLDLTKMPRDQMARLFQPDAVSHSLVIQHLIVARAEDATSLIMANRNLQFLGLGNIIIKAENKSSASSVRSLALGFMSEGSALDLHNANALTNLSIDMSSYPRVESLLSDLVQTVTSTPAPKRVFINCGPGMVKSDNQQGSATTLWNTLDSYLSNLPDLERVVCTMVIEGGMTMFMRIPGAMGGMFEKWKDELLQYMGSKLPLCLKKDRLDVVQVAGSWTSCPFGDVVELPE